MDQKFSEFREFGESVNNWSMNWAQFKDPVSHMCLAGTVVVSWSLTQEFPGLSPFITAHKLSLWRLYFTPVCQSGSQGGSVSVHAGIADPPGAYIPQEQTHPCTVHAGNMANKWAVRILLECILVDKYFYHWNWVKTFRKNSITLTYKFALGINL